MPVNGFERFFRKKVEEAKGCDMPVDFCKIQAVAAEEWQRMTQEQKAVYKKQAAEFKKSEQYKCRKGKAIRMISSRYARNGHRHQPSVAACDGDDWSWPESDLAYPEAINNEEQINQSEVAQQDVIGIPDANAVNSENEWGFDSHWRAESAPQNLSQVVDAKALGDEERRDTGDQLEFLQHSLSHITLPAVEQQIFYFISFEYFCEFGSYAFCPAEVAVVEMCLERGVCDVFHCAIQPPLMPDYYKYQATERAATTHGIPFEGDGTESFLSCSAMTKKLEHFLPPVSMASKQKKQLICFGEEYGTTQRCLKCIEYSAGRDNCLCCFEIVCVEDWLSTLHSELNADRCAKPIDSRIFYERCLEKIGSSAPSEFMCKCHKSRFKPQCCATLKLLALCKVICEEWDSYRCGKTEEPDSSRFNGCRRDAVSSSNENTDASPCKGLSLKVARSRFQSDPVVTGVLQPTDDIFMKQISETEKLTDSSSDSDDNEKNA